jgi:hypothetical protein
MPKSDWNERSTNKATKLEKKTNSKVILRPMLKVVAEKNSSEENGGSEEVHGKNECREETGGGKIAGGKNEGSE